MLRGCLTAQSAVCFDVDSTVCTDEGIDELAKWCRVGSQVSKQTKAAMSNRRTCFRESLRKRLEIIRPSKQLLNAFVDNRVPRLNDGIENLVRVLQKERVEVYLISGGFRSMIAPVASMLCVPDTNVYANTLLFDPMGAYVGFDEMEPTSRSGGKSDVVRALKRKHDMVIMVGDGITDLETKGVADLFVGYGGVCVRSEVREHADWYITHFDEF
jgi:phosphoserine phosphatase